VQIPGIILLIFVVAYGFVERSQTTISAFDLHAAIVVLCGSLSAVLISSSFMTAVRTFSCLREVIPGLGVLGPGTKALEVERVKLAELWLQGQRARAVEMAERSDAPMIRRMLDLALGRAPQEAIAGAFTELRHAEISRWQPAICNWELLAKLAPSFGMVGTITGMIKLFQKMGEDKMDLGAAISLALLATLYGVAFGAGIAGPIGHYLRNLLDERLGVLERAEQTVAELVARHDAVRWS